ncbi:MAG: M14 family zinc carboxypeptidase [Gemmatimonadaceae bacterium]
MMPPLSLALVAVALFIAAPASAQQSTDAEYARLVREYTSDPLFLPATVATLPDHPTMPSPREHFGTVIGAPGVMHRTSEIYGYYRALAAATPRVKVEKVGTTEEGRDLLLLTIAGDALLPQIEEQKAIAARLADPRRLPASELDAVLARAKPIYYISGGLHSPEMGSPEMLMELVYRLVASDEPQIRTIRDNVITLINPVAEPDGRDKQVDWYHRYTKARTEWDDGFPRSPPYWGKYVYHDNNRDGIQMSQELTKSIYRSYFEWFPVVSLDLHESVPLLYISTGTGPYNETLDPITIGEWHLFAQNEVTQLTAQGLPGVWTWGFYDGWYPGYALWITNNHNGIGRFYETFGNAGANTYIRDLTNSRFAGNPVTSRQWYRPFPPTQKVRWGARDNVNFMQAGVIASLAFTAHNSDQLLRNFWQKGVNSMRRGSTEKPHAYTIPAFERQRDPKRTAYLVNQLRRHGLEVHRRESGESAGDFVVLLNQPYRNFAVSLLGKQNFPADETNPPYDDIAWTLGYMYGVEVKAVDDSAVFGWPGLTLLSDTVAATADVSGSGGVHVLQYKAQAEVLPALYLIRERSRATRVTAAEAPFIAGSKSYAEGSLIIENLGDELAREIARTFALPLERVSAVPAVQRHAVDLPRVAVYHTWTNTQDEGWVRFTFDQARIPYASINKDDLRRGNLRSRFDVILVPNTGGAGVETLIHEHDTKFGPRPYTKTAEFPSHGTPSSTADMTGGPGFEGLAQLNRFVNEGGTLITLHGATRLAAETGIARALSPYTASSLFHPGSIVRMMARRPNHPVWYGYPDTTNVFRGNGPLFQVNRRDRGMIVAQFGTRTPRDEEEPTGRFFGIPETPRPGAGEASPPPGVAPAVDSAAPRAGAAQAGGRGGSGSSEYVLSGMVRNQDQIIGQGAIFDVPVGRGRVITFSFNPLHRYLNHHEFPLVWNSIMHWNDGINR